MDDKKILCRFEPLLGKVLFSANGVLMATDLKNLDEYGRENFSLVKKETILKNALSAPITVQIQTTNRCNFRCRHCYVSSEKTSSSEMSNDDLFSLLNSLKDWGVLKIQWVGGEVFVRKGFWKLAEYAETLGFEQSLLTNGSFFGTTRKTEFIKKAWDLFYIIQVSVDDYKEQFNSFVGRKAWDIVMNSIHKLSSYKPDGRKLTVATILHQENVKSLCKIASCVNNLADVWRLGKEIATGRSNRDQEDTIRVLFESWPVVKDLRDKFKDLLITHPFDKEYSDEGAMLLPHDWRSDNGARIFMYVSSDGKAYPFPLLVNIDSFCGGSVFSKSFDDIWSSKEFETYRSVTREETGCSGCVEPCQIWSRYHFIHNDRLDLREVPFPHPGCPRFEE